VDDRSVVIRFDDRGTAARTVSALAFAAVVAIAYSFAAPSTGDLAAQTHRAELVADAGPTVWDNFWFGGHHLPGYSVLFPMLGALLSPIVAGAVAMVVSVALFVIIARPRSWRLHVAALWFTIGMAANLVSGRLTFVLGVAVALLAVLCATRGWVGATALVAATTALASPVAASLLVLAGCTIVVVDWRDPRQRSCGVAMAVVPGVAIGVTNRLFPEGGTFPFPTWAFAQAIMLTAVCVALIPREARHARVGLVVYGAACIATFAVPSPLGGNVVRLGTLLAGPVLVATATARRFVVVALAALLLVWQWEAPVYDLLRLRGDPSVHAAFYRPLMQFLDHQGPEPFRVEVPATANHWEAAFVARRIPLARGWERQLDRKYNELFYEPALTAREYRRWLRNNGVRFVVVPALPLRDFDYSSRSEIKLVRAGLPYLDEVWRSDEWRVLSVSGPPALVRGPARMTSLSTDEFQVHTDEAARIIVRIRWSPNFYVASGSACIGASPDGWTVLSMHTAGSVTVAAHIDADDAFRLHPDRCPSSISRLNDGGS
jgi:hypothetical protein